jgi:transcriptional enhancer factor
MRSRQHAQRTDSVAKHEYNMSSPHVWPHHGGPQQNLAFNSDPNRDSPSSPFTVTDLSIVVDGDDQPMHCLTEVHLNGKLDSSDIADLASWRHQYPVFDFLRSETDDWISSGREVLICTASIKVVVEVQPKADLTITFGLYSHLDLSRYDYLECMTRFYDDRQGSVDPELDSMNRDQKERHMCVYRPDSHESKGILRVKFDVPFSLARLRLYQNMSHMDDRSVRDSPLTAVQDIYGIIPGTSETHCLCTVLWRFQQTRNSAEYDSLKWRSISFAKGRSPVEERWCHEAEDHTEDLGDAEVKHEQTTNAPTSTPTDVTPYHQASQLPVDLVQTHTSHRSY